MTPKFRLSTIAAATLFLSACFTLNKSDQSRGPASEMRILRDADGQPANLANSPFFRSTLSWRGQGGNFANCSSTWVSNDGLALTAFHCIRSCLENSSFERVKNQDGTESYKTIKNARGDSVAVENGLIKKIEVPNTLDPYNNPYVVYEVDSKKLKTVSCPDGNIKGLSVKILALGAKGWIREDMWASFSQRYPEIFKKYRELGYVGVGDIGDFALIHFERTPSTPLDLSQAKYFSYPPSCLKIKPDAIEPGEKVWNLSFPAYSRSADSSSHYEPRVSGGLVFSKDHHPLFSAAQFKESSFDENFLYASTDIEGGSSGSSLFDANGQIVGIVGRKVAGPNQYVLAATTFVPTPLVLRRIGQVMGPAFVERLQNSCVPSAQGEVLLNLIRQTVPTEN